MRCEHQRFRKGCAIYASRPHSCALWNCRWLVEDDTADLRRPDWSGYVIDIVPDFITIQDDKTGAKHIVQIVQIWIDPRRPLAHRDPALRAYLERRAAEGIAALVRFDSKDAMVLIAPALSNTGEWIEHTSTQSEGRDHSAAEIVAALAGGAP